jgi:hypothetical protein
MTPSELLDLAWSYPLFEALYGRRSRRFCCGPRTSMSNRASEETRRREPTA